MTHTHFTVRKSVDVIKWGDICFIFTKLELQINLKRHTLINVFCFMQTDFNLLLTPLTNQAIIFCVIAGNVLIKLSLDGYHWEKYNINWFCWNDSEFNENKSPLAKTIGMNVYPWYHYFCIYRQYSFSTCWQKLYSLKSIHISISHYYEMLYLWINFLFVKMK